MLQERQ
jgi:hypothetical protein